MICVVVDLNGVLIHRRWVRGDKQRGSPDRIFIPMKGKGGGMYVAVRPYAIALLERILAREDMRLVFWSSMTLEYMMPIVTLLQTKLRAPADAFDVLSQEDCTMEPHPKVTYKPLFLKDVQKVLALHPNVEDVIFIDDSEEKMRVNEGAQIIIVKEWDGMDAYDDTLKVDVIRKLFS